MTPERLQELLPEANVVAIEVPTVLMHPTEPRLVTPEEAAAGVVPTRNYVTTEKFWAEQFLVRWREESRGKTIFCYPCKDWTGHEVMGDPSSREFPLEVARVRLWRSREEYERCVKASEAWWAEWEVKRKAES